MAALVGVLASLGVCGFVMAQEYQTAEQPIVGGREANEREFYSTVSIQFDQEPHCTGTLIAPRVVLTAAHCLVEDPDQSMSPTYGSDRFEVIVNTIDSYEPFEEDIYTIRAVVPHANFPLGEESDDTSLGRDNDIGLLILNDQPQGVPIAPIVSPSAFESEVGVGQRFVITGYGLTDPDNEDSAGVLYIGEAEYSRASDYEFILGGAGQPDSCQGDSGGPAYLASSTSDYILVGVTARAVATATAACGEGGIYTLAPAYLDWIESNSQGEFTATHVSNPGEDTFESDGFEDGGEFADEDFDRAEEDDDYCDCRIRLTKDSRSLPWTSLGLLALGLGLMMRRRH